MALLTIESNNPKFSYIIVKNPNSPMTIKSNRRGHCFGFFAGDDKYAIYFRDSDTEVSYKRWADESFEFINTSRYNSAHFVLSAIGDFFNSAVKLLQPDDGDGFENTITVNMMRIKRMSCVNVFNDFLKDFKIDTEELSIGNFKVKISTKRSIRELLNFTNLFALVATLMNNEDWFDISNSAIIKYVNCLQVIDPPYFIRYLIKRDILGSNKYFKEHKKLFEKTNQHKSIKMTWGSSTVARRNCVVDRLNSIQRDEHRKVVVDVGCGDGFYLFDLIQKYDEYHAIDVNPFVEEKLQKKAERKGCLDKLKFYSSLDDFIKKNKGLKVDDVVCAEVIEHMEQNEAIKFMKKIIKKIDFKNIVITTPNADFNQFFLFEENQLRHVDHKFEVGEDDFVTMLDKAGFKDMNYGKVFNIGDVVDEISSSIGYIGSKNERNGIKTSYSFIACWSYWMWKDLFH